jgi:hypothetical protein
MWKDPIVQDVRENRKKLAQKFNFNIKKMMEHAQKRQKASGCKVVSFSVAHKNSKKK